MYSNDKHKAEIQAKNTLNEAMKFESALLEYHWIRYLRSYSGIFQLENYLGKFEQQLPRSHP